MKDQKIPVSRPLVGILALTCFAAAAAILFTQSNFVSVVFQEQKLAIDEAWWMWLGGFVRVGLLLAAFWVALPSRNRQAAWANVSPWTFGGMLVAVVMVALRPRVIVPLLLVAAVLGFLLRPRRKRGSSRQ